MIKKVIYILIMIIISTNLALAETQNGSLDYNIYQYSFHPEDSAKFLKNAESNMKAWENSILKYNREFYLREAMRYYFLLSRINQGSMEANIGLGRIYDEMKQDRLAKKHFFLAYNIDNSNPKLNLYFGNFYYKRNDLITASKHYKKAYNAGYAKDFSLNYRLGTVYEKLADLEASKNYYLNARKLTAKNPDLDKKIRLLDELNYSGSQYYLFKK